MNFEEAPIHPMEFSPSNTDADELWVCNITDASVTVFDIGDADPNDPNALPEVEKVIPVGLGPVAVRRRPGNHDEMWVVCTTSNAIFIIDEVDKVVEHVISFYEELDSTSQKVEGFTQQEPMDLVFDSSGKNAWVSLSVSNHIAVIDADSRAWTLAFPFGSEFDPDSAMGSSYGVDRSFLEVEEPRTLFLDGSTLYALSFESGNGSFTAPSSRITPDVIVKGEKITNTSRLIRGGKIVNTWRFWEIMVDPNDPNDPNVIDPPDRDVIAFDASDPAALDPSVTDVFFRVGTICYDMEKSSDASNLSFYISNVELHNFDQDPNATVPKSATCGEELLATVRAMASHRITVIEPNEIDGGINPSSLERDTTGRLILDLNDPDNHTSLDPNVRFSFPTEICMGNSGATLAVACYESGNTAVVKIVGENKHKVIGVLKSDGFGPRGVIKDETKNLVYVYNRGDHTIDRFNMNPFSLGETVSPDIHFSAGLDITPKRVIEGRRHFIDPTNSFNGLQSCQTCHVDGHVDRLAWCLDNVVTANPDDPNDPNSRLDPNGGALDSNSRNGRKFLARKSAKVTMSLRGIEETPPFHWQGDRNDLIDFNDALRGLVGGVPLDISDLTDPNNDFAEFEGFIFSLSYPPNPRQKLDRTLDTDAATGFDDYRDATDLTPHLVRGGVGDTSKSCNDCHAMTLTTRGGGSGTLNQVVNDQQTTNLFPDDVAQLRGLTDKISAVAQTGFNLGNSIDSGDPNSALWELPVSGFGFTNNGTLDSIRQAVDRFNVDHEKVTMALEQFDTGMSPAIGAVEFLHDGETTLPLVDKLIAEADAGRCDLIVRGWWREDSTSSKHLIKMQYFPSEDPNDPNGTFLTDIDAGYDPNDPVWYQPSYTIGDIEDMADQSSTDSLGDGEFAFIPVPIGTAFRLGRDRDMDALVDRDESVVYNTDDNKLDTDNDGLPDGHELYLDPNDPDAPSDPNITPSDTVHDGIVTNSLDVAWHNSNVARVRWRTVELSTSKIDLLLESPNILIRTFTENTLKHNHTMVVRGMTPEKNYKVRVGGTDSNGNEAATELDDIDPDVFFMNHTFVASVTIVPNGCVGDKVNYIATIQVVDKNGDAYEITDDPNAPVGSGVVIEIVEWIPGEEFENILDPGNPNGASNPIILLEYNDEQDLPNNPGKFVFEFTSLHDYTASKKARVEVIVKEVIDETLLNLDPRSVREFHAQRKVDACTE